MHLFLQYESAKYESVKHDKSNIQKRRVCFPMYNYYLAIKIKR